MTTIAYADIRKGMRVMLRNGWEADVLDNARGNTRLCKVYGYATESGSVYAHNIVSVIEPNVPASKTVIHTEGQKKFRQKLVSMAFLGN